MSKLPLVDRERILAERFEKRQLMRERWERKRLLRGQKRTCTYSRILRGVSDCFRLHVCLCLCCAAVAQTSARSTRADALERYKAERESARARRKRLAKVGFAFSVCS